MDTPPDYQAIPSAHTQIPSNPTDQRYWADTLRARLPRRSSLSTFFLFSAAAIVVLLTVTSTNQSSTHYRSAVWARFTTDPVTHTRHTQLIPRTFRSSTRPYPPFLHDRWFHHGRCYLKCRKQGGPEVCCRRNNVYTERRNACMCDCLGGNVFSEGVCLIPTPGEPTPQETPSCECDLDLNSVCCKADDRTSMELNACVCKCKPGGTVVSADVCYPSPSPVAQALGETPVETPSCDCDLDLNSVCCKADDRTSMELNECICECKPGGKVVPDTYCGAPTPTPEPAKECMCPLVFAPVCCKTAEGSDMEVNECVCECKDGGEVVPKAHCA